MSSLSGVRGWILVLAVTAFAFVGALFQFFEWLTFDEAPAALRIWGTVTAVGAALLAVWPWRVLVLAAGPDLVREELTCLGWAFRRRPLRSSGRPSLRVSTARWAGDGLVAELLGLRLEVSWEGGGRVLLATHRQALLKQVARLSRLLSTPLVDDTRLGRNRQQALALAERFGLAQPPEMGLQTDFQETGEALRLLVPRRPPLWRTVLLLLLGTIILKYVEVAVDRLVPWDAARESLLFLRMFTVIVLTTVAGRVWGRKSLIEAEPGRLLLRDKEFVSPVHIRAGGLSPTAIKLMALGGAGAEGDLRTLLAEPEGKWVADLLTQAVNRGLPGEAD